MQSTREEQAAARFNRELTRKFFNNYDVDSDYNAVFKHIKYDVSCIFNMLFNELVETFVWHMPNNTKKIVRGGFYVVDSFTLHLVKCDVSRSSSIIGNPKNSYFTHDKEHLDKILDFIKCDTTTVIGKYKFTKRVTLYEQEYSGLDTGTYFWSFWVRVSCEVVK